MHAANGDAQADPDPKRLASGGGAMSTDAHSHLGDLAPELVERLDDTCDRFEAEWKAGRRPKIKDHLSDAAETERATWLRELLALELDWRRRRGERPTPWEYL